MHVHDDDRSILNLMILLVWTESELSWLISDVHEHNL